MAHVRKWRGDTKIIFNYQKLKMDVRNVGYILINKPKFTFNNVLRATDTKHKMAEKSCRTNSTAHAIYHRFDKLIGGKAPSWSIFESTKPLLISTNFFALSISLKLIFIEPVGYFIKIFREVLLAVESPLISFSKFILQILY
ncbi:MAG: hypothetical protein DRR19_25325 [Candidatus Parabeggiatoa sp. nov. 1]|nr:MAG: hypothetical protein DRR19_25325 [Gammaproteobacteria bacterium]